MTTWAGHTTNAARNQFYVPCKCCGRSRRLTLSALVVAWLDDNPDESLTVRDVAAKWEVAESSATGALNRGELSGKLKRRRHEKRGIASEWVSAKGAG